MRYDMHSVTACIYLLIIRRSPVRLYRMELYKLYHQKSFIICGVFTLFITVFYFWAAGIDSEFAVVDGVRYQGYEAVRVNRQITEEFRGALTDEKVERIVEKYGIPSELEDDVPGWQDANYLNDFVAEYLSDGEWRTAEDKIPTKVYAIADTELGELQRVTGEEIRFAYTKGWKVLMDSLQMGMVLANITVLLSVSVVFSQEGQTRMLPLLSTTQEGKGKDVWAKIAASFTLTIMVYAVVALLCIVMSAGVFGLDGGDCSIVVAMQEQGQIFFNARVAASYMPVKDFALIILGMGLMSMLLVCAITMCVSAHCRSTFESVTIAAVLWALPLLIRLFFGGFLYFITSCMPLFLTMTDSVCEMVSWGWGQPMVWVISVLSVFCVEEGYRVYKRM